MKLNALIKMAFIGLFCLGLASTAQAAKLQLLVIIDTGDENIGTDVSVDMANVVTLAHRTAKAAGLTFDGTAIVSSSFPQAALKNGRGKHAAFDAKFAKFEGIKIKTIKKFDRKTVTNTLNGLKVGKDDVLWTHYAGHGFRWESQNKNSNRWPALDLGGWASADGDGAVEAAKSILMSTVADIAEGKNARLTITIADSCNEIAEGLKQPKRAARGRGSDKSKAGFIKLFKKARGKIRIASTKPGELAWGDSEVGGVFTYKFIQNLITEAKKGDKGEWKSILGAFKGKTISMMLASGEESESQHPQVEYTVTYGKAAQTTPGTARPGHLAGVKVKSPRVAGKNWLASIKRLRQRKPTHKCADGRLTAQNTCLIAKVDVNTYDKKCATKPCRCAVRGLRKGRSQIECISTKRRCAKGWKRRVIRKKRGRSKFSVTLCSSRSFKTRSTRCRIKMVYGTKRLKKWGMTKRRPAVIALRQNTKCPYHVSSQNRGVFADAVKVKR